MTTVPASVRVVQVPVDAGVSFEIRTAAAATPEHYRRCARLLFDIADGLEGTDRTDTIARLLEGDRARIDAVRAAAGYAPVPTEERIATVTLDRCALADRDELAQTCALARELDETIRVVVASGIGYRVRSDGTLGRESPATTADLNARDDARATPRYGLSELERHSRERSVHPQSKCDRCGAVVCGVFLIGERCNAFARVEQPADCGGRYRERVIRCDRCATETTGTFWIGKVHEHHVGSPAQCGGTYVEGDRAA